jgi:hypothetical protein
VVTRRKKKIPKIVAIFIYASSQGQRTHSARTNNLPKIVSTFVYASNQGQRTHSAQTNKITSAGEQYAPPQVE